MFDWLKKLDPETRGLAEITRRFEQMLEDGRHVFDAASNALLGGTDVEVIREDLFKTDRRINETERQIRRLLLVHGSVHGAPELPELLVMMSLVKDAERIGDYGKNLFDLAALDGGRIDPEERAALVDLKDEISRLLVRARNVYDEEDRAAATELLQRAKDLEDRCDESVDRLIRATGRNQAATVLTFRYFKRVVSHAANIATSLVVPVDQLDFFDEPRERPPAKER